MEVNKRDALNLYEFVREQQQTICQLSLNQRGILHALQGFDPILRHRLEAALDVARQAYDAETSLLLQRIDELVGQLKHGG